MKAVAVVESHKGTDELILGIRLCRSCQSRTVVVAVGESVFKAENGKAARTPQNLKANDDLLLVIWPLIRLAAGGNVISNAILSRLTES